MSTTFRRTRTGIYLPRGLSYLQEQLADSPLALYRLNEANPATVALDASGNGHNGSFVTTSFIAYQRPSMVPTSADLSANFTGGGARVEVADAAWLHPSTFTIEAIARYDYSSGNIGTTMAIASKTVGGTVNATNYQFMLYKPASSSNIAVIVASSAGAVTLVDTSSFLTQLFPLRHVAATFDGTNVKLYGNGVQLQSTALGGTLAPCTAAKLILAETAGGGRNWIGGLDEVAYYGTALSAARIAAHFAASGI